MPKRDWSVYRPQKRLQRLVAAIAQDRGHQLTDWELDDRTFSFCWCLRCGFALTVDTKPEAPDTAVSGSVAARACPGVRGMEPAW